MNLNMVLHLESMAKSYQGKKKTKTFFYFLFFGHGWVPVCLPLEFSLITRYYIKKDIVIILKQSVQEVPFNN